MTEYIFTDGSTHNNHKKKHRTGGYGVFFGDKDPRNVSKTIDYGDITNNIAELKACIDAITLSNKNMKTIIVTDSMYCINCITVWYDNWVKNNWKNARKKPVANKELIQTLYSLYCDNNVEFKHVNSHLPEPEKDSDEYFFWYGNMMADMLANKR
jgi:ribonuclease HI